MKSTIIKGLVALLMSWSVFAGDVLKLKSDHPEIYVVKKGDTLWDISGMFLSDPWLWPKLWRVNPQIDNPHLIYPGDQLHLVYIDGQPQLVVKRGRDVKLTPQVRISDLDLAIPTIPLDAIGPFLTRSRVLSSDELSSAPHILAGKDGHIVSGAGDQIYGRGEFDENEDSYGIFRRGDNYIDPETGEFLGVQAFDIGSAKLVELDGEIATMALNRTTEEVRRADRLLPMEERKVIANFAPKVPDADINGQIIAVEGGVSQIGFMDVVVINRGERDALQAGDVLAIYRTGAVVRDVVEKDMVKVPDYRAGLMMVFRTFEKVSYGLVLRAERPLAVKDKIRNP